MSAYRDAVLSERIGQLEKENDALERRLPEHVRPLLPSKAWAELERTSRAARDLAKGARESEERGLGYERALLAKKASLEAALADAGALREKLSAVPGTFPDVEVHAARGWERLGIRWARFAGTELWRSATRAKAALFEAVSRIGHDPERLEVLRETAGAMSFVMDDAPMVATTLVVAARRRPLVITKLRTRTARGVVHARVDRTIGRGAPRVEVVGLGEAEAAVTAALDATLPALGVTAEGYKLTSRAGLAELTTYDDPDEATFAAGAEVLIALRRAPVASWVDAIR